MYKLASLGLALLLAGPAAAQSAAPPETPLTLARAIALALERNPELAAARKEVTAVEAGVRQAAARPNPELSALMEDTRKSTRSTTLQLNQPIELGDKRAARIDAAERERAIADITLAIKRDDIRSSVTAAFFGVIIASERARLAQEASTLAHQATNATGRRVAAGKISPVEETKARIAASAARLEWQQADGELASARQQLASYWGDADINTMPVTEDKLPLPALPAIAHLTAQSANAPALKLARVEIERRQALTRIESSKRIPDLTLSVGTKRDEEAGRNMWVLGVSMPLPLFDSNRGNLQEALQRTDQARDELVAAEVRVRSEVAQAYRKLRNAHDEIMALRTDILPGARSAYDAVGRGFALGKFSFLEVLDAQRTLFQAQTQHLRALSDAHLAFAELERLLGAGALTP